MLTQNDKHLIEYAEKLNYCDYGEIDELIMLADTREAKQRLRDIAITLYHKEEYYAGNL